MKPLNASQGATVTGSCSNEQELTEKQIGGLLQYFGLYSNQSLQILRKGIDVITRLQRS
ncbi:MAG: hypothetical protein ACREBU_10545 [Nitrososphaera sp.]